MLKQMYPDFILVEQCEQQKQKMMYTFSVTATMYGLLLWRAVNS